MTMTNHTISLPEDMNTKIESDLSYGDSKSAWIRQGIRYRFIVDEMVSEELDDDERVALVEDALAAHLDE